MSCVNRGPADAGESFQKERPGKIANIRSISVAGNSDGLVQPWAQSEGSFLASVAPFIVGHFFSSSGKANTPLRFLPWSGYWPQRGASALSAWWPLSPPRAQDSPVVPEPGTVSAFPMNTLILAGRNFAFHGHRQLERQPCHGPRDTKTNVVVLVRGIVIVAVRGAQVVLGVVPVATADRAILGRLLPRVPKRNSTREHRPAQAPTLGVLGVCHPRSHRLRDI